MSNSILPLVPEPDAIDLNRGYEQWVTEYGLRFEPNYNAFVEADCKAAFIAGTQSPIPQSLIPQIVEALEFGYKAAVSHVKSFDPEINKLCQEEIAKLSSTIAALKQIGGA